jgi:hypothetical protein
MKRLLPGSFTEATFHHLVQEKLHTIAAEGSLRMGELVSSQQRAQAFAAHDSAVAWQQLATTALAHNQTTEAAIAHAAACWLDPQLANDQLPLVSLDDELTRGLDATQPFRERHWHVWAMKEDSTKAHTYIPALLRAAADANFSLRARVYRSLGQSGHPAVIQCLHEGTADPHAFARAQAIRSLGWLGDPTGVPLLLHCATDDAHAVVRRTAAAAVERIVGYWLLYGEWQAISDSPERWYAALHLLGETGLSTVMADILWYHQKVTATDPMIMQLKAQIQADRAARRAARSLPEVSYHDFFPEADGFEVMLNATLFGLYDSRPAWLRLLAEWLRSDYPELHLTGLAIVSRRHATELTPLVEQFLNTPHPEIVWHARRTLRCLDAGTMAQRRTNPGHPSWVAL